LRITAVEWIAGKDVCVFQRDVLRIEVEHSRRELPHRVRAGYG
jgi:hypothetical protein